MAYVNYNDFRGTFIVHSKPPTKEISLAVALLILGTIIIAVGLFLSSQQIGGDRTHGIVFALLGTFLFVPGFYYSRIAWYAYKGYKGFSFANIPAV